MPELAFAMDKLDTSLPQGDEMKLLAQRAVGGDRLAFSQLVEGNYDFVFATAFKWCGNREDAEDVAQDVCVKLARVLKSYDGRAAFTTWLYRIVINAVHDLQRFRMRQSKQASELKETAMAQIEPSQEQSALTNELWAAVRALPDQQRDAMLLVYGEDKSHREVAEILDCKESTVSWHVHAAKKALKKLL